MNLLSLASVRLFLSSKNLPPACRSSAASRAGSLRNVLEITYSLNEHRDSGDLSSRFFHEKQYGSYGFLPAGGKACSPPTRSSLIPPFGRDDLRACLTQSAASSLGRAHVVCERARMLSAAVLNAVFTFSACTLLQMFL